MSMKKRARRAASPLIPILAAIVLAAPAGAAAPERFSLDDVVITASRSGSLLRDLPSNATVLKVDEAAVPPRSVDSLLDAAGVDVDGSADAQTVNRNVTLRGAGSSSRVLVLLDGMPVQDPNSGFVEWGALGVESADRVEVVRGPVSGLYGSQAMGGVVNVVSRLPSRPNETEASASGGSLGTRAFRLRQAGDLGRWGYSLTARHLATDGYVAEKFPASYNVMRTREEYTLHPKLLFRPAKGATVTLGLSHGGDRFVPGRYYRKRDQTDTMGYAHLELGDNDRGAQARLYYLVGRQWRDKDASPTYRFLDSRTSSRTQNLGGGVEGHLKAGAWGKFSAGFDMRSGRNDEENAGVVTKGNILTKGGQLNAGGFVQNESSWLSDRLLVTLGLRADWFRSEDGWIKDTTPGSSLELSYDRRDFGTVNPRFGLVYKRTDRLSLRAAAGRGFVAPTIANLYGYIKAKTASIRGNPQIEAESLWSYEAGADWRPLDGLTARLTSYYNRGRNYIAQRVVSATLRQYDNIGRVETWGIEAEARWQALPDLSLAGAYSLDRSTIISDPVNPGTVGQAFVFTHPNKASLSARYGRPGIVEASARLRYKDRAYADILHHRLGQRRLTLDLGLARSVGEHVRLRADCENVNGHRYDVFESADEVLLSPGRLISGTIEVRF